MRLEEEIGVANPEHPHCPVVFVLDTSGSMAGNSIRELNEGLRTFRDDVASDDLASKRVELAIITFGSTVHVVQDFVSIGGFNPPTFDASGSTAMGEAILLAAELVEQRKKTYRENGVDYYRPWVFLVTDGAPTDMRRGDSRWNDVIHCVHDGEKGRKFLFFAVGVEEADTGTLAEIAPPTRRPIKLRHGNFREMFLWVSRSQQRVSASRVGEQVELENPLGPQGWGEVPSS